MLQAARLTKLLKGFRKDRRGVAAVEFALIAPILLCMFFVTMEVSQAIEVNRKVNRLSGSVGDLIAQQTRVDPEDLEAIMQIGEAVLQPYRRSNAKITLTGIGMSDEAKPKSTVAWSATLEEGKFRMHPVKKGAAVAVPQDLLERGTFLVKVVTAIDYKPIIAWTNDGKARLGLLGAFTSIGMGERYYFRPRLSLDVKCEKCG